MQRGRCQPPSCFGGCRHLPRHGGRPAATANKGSRRSCNPPGRMEEALTRFQYGLLGEVCPWLAHPGPLRSPRGRSTDMHTPRSCGPPGCPCAPGSSRTRGRGVCFFFAVDSLLLSAKTARRRRVRELVALLGVFLGANLHAEPFCLTGISEASHPGVARVTCAGRRYNGTDSHPTRPSVTPSIPGRHPWQCLRGFAKGHLCRTLK